MYSHTALRKRILVWYTHTSIEILIQRAMSARFQKHLFAKVSPNSTCDISQTQVYLYIHGNLSKRSVHGAKPTIIIKLKLEKIIVDKTGLISRVLSTGYPCMDDQVATNIQRSSLSKVPSLIIIRGSSTLVYYLEYHA